MSQLADIGEVVVAAGQEVLVEHVDLLEHAHEEQDLHHQLAEIFEIVVAVIDVMTVVVILYGFIFAIFLFVKMHINNLFGEKHAAVDLSVIRVKLGSYLLLALELFIASDIILTIGDPSFQHLVQLGVIVVIRIVISHFLQQEMHELTEDGVHH